MNKMSEPNKPKFGLHCKAYNATVETDKTHPYRLHNSAHQNLLSFHRFELKNLNRISRGRTEFLSHFHSPNFQTFVHRSPAGTSWSDEQNSKSDATNPNFRTPVRRIPESTILAKSDEAHLVHTLVQRTKHKARWCDERKRSNIKLWTGYLKANISSKNAFPIIIIVWVFNIYFARLIR